MAENPTKKDNRRQKHDGKRGAKALRDRAVIEKAMEGKKTTEIASDLGMSRQAVSQVLNSDQVKAKIKDIDARLAQGIDDAIDLVLQAVKVDYDAAYDLLKNFGSMKAGVDLNHRFPKPLVIKRLDGSTTVLGTEADLTEEEKK